MRRPPNAPLRDTSEGGSGSFATFPRTTERSPNNVPLELSSFIGREREMTEIKRLLADTPLLTLTGPGGCGKTRLALEVADDLAEGFEDGVWWVELASLADPSLVPQAVASVLRVREQPGRSLTATLSEHLKPKKLLLILDNCEHLVEACAALARRLLRACLDLRVLATSREALGLAGETSWLVPPLSLPERSPPALEDLARYEAVRLFVERAGAELSSFALTERNAPAVARVCRRLDGMPLAIELAASRVRVLAVEQIAERLDDCFRLLRAGRREALPRHKTLRATMDWSYGLLSEEEQALFRRLSVFAGGSTLEAAEEVCAGRGIEEDEVLDLLSHLVDKSLVVMEERGGEARYRFLETVRQYAQEKLDESEEEAVATRRRHAGYFLKLAETAEPSLLGPEQEAWMGRLEVEHDNLRAALDWSEEEEAGGGAEAGLRLAGALPRFWWIRGYFTEGRTRLETLLGLPEASGRSAARAKACHTLGMLYYRRGYHAAGDFAEARACYEESLGIFRELGDEAQIAATLTELGRVDTELGDYDSARSLLEESLMLQRRLGNEHGIALAQYGLGWLDLLRGEHARARPLLEESLAIFRRLGDKYNMGATMMYLECLICEQGDYSEARSRCVQMTELLSFQQYRYVAPFVLDAFALLAAAQGRAGRALRLAGAAEELRRALGTQLRRSWQQYVTRRLEAAWQASGEEAGAAAWAEGQAMSLEEAIAYARGETYPHTAETAGSSRVEPASADAKSLPVLRIFALGPARVQRGEEVLASSEWTYAKSRELLFYLLSHPSRTKAQIGLALWSEASPSQLRKTFHVTLHHLRRALGSPEWISFEKDRYSFNRSLSYWYDIEAFESKLAEARRLIELEGPTQEAIFHLKEAVGLYGGDFLENCAEGEWALIRQEELRRTYQEALLELGGLLFGEGRYGEAAEAYRKAIEHYAYLESAHRELMRCQGRLGERSQALRHYRDLGELLREELGSSPAPETTELYERLRQGEDV